LTNYHRHTIQIYPLNLLIIMYYMLNSHPNAASAHQDRSFVNNSSIACDVIWSDI